MAQNPPDLQTQFDEDCVCAYINTRHCPVHGQPERRWLVERFLFWIATRSEIAAYALARRRRG